MKNQKPITTKTLTDKEKLFAELAAEIIMLLKLNLIIS